LYRTRVWQIQSNEINQSIKRILCHITSGKIVFFIHLFYTILIVSSCCQFIFTGHERRIGHMAHKEANIEQTNWERKKQALEENGTTDGGKRECPARQLSNSFAAHKSRFVHQSR